MSGLGEATKNVHAEMEYFHILFGELRIYFNQTRGDCKKVKKKIIIIQDGLGYFDFGLVSSKSVLYNKFQGNQPLLGLVEERANETARTFSILLYLYASNLKLKELVNLPLS